MSFVCRCEAVEIDGLGLNESVSSKATPPPQFTHGAMGLAWNADRLFALQKLGLSGEGWAVSWMLMGRIRRGGVD